MARVYTRDMGSDSPARLVPLSFSLLSLLLASFALLGWHRTTESLRSLESTFNALESSTLTVRGLRVVDAKGETRCVIRTGSLGTEVVLSGANGGRVSISTDVANDYESNEVAVTALGLSLKDGHSTARLTAGRVEFHDRESESALTTRSIRIDSTEEGNDWGFMVMPYSAFGPILSMFRAPDLGITLGFLTEGPILELAGGEEPWASKVKAVASRSGLQAGTGSLVLQGAAGEQTRIASGD